MKINSIEGDWFSDLLELAMDDGAIRAYDFITKLQIPHAVTDENDSTYHTFCDALNFAEDTNSKRLNVYAYNYNESSLFFAAENQNDLKQKMYEAYENWKVLTYR